LHTVNGSPAYPVSVRTRNIREIDVHQRSIVTICARTQEGNEAAAIEDERLLRPRVEGTGSSGSGKVRIKHSLFLSIVELRGWNMLLVVVILQSKVVRGRVN